MHKLGIAPSVSPLTHAHLFKSTDGMNLGGEFAVDPLELAATDDEQEALDALVVAPKISGEHEVAAS